MNVTGPSIVRIVSWFLSAALFSIALAGLFLNTNDEILVNEQQKVELSGSVLGADDSTSTSTKTSESFEGAVYAFHRLLDSQIEEENYDTVLKIAEELPSSSQKNLAIQTILQDLWDSTDSKIETLGEFAFSEESKSENNTDVEEMLIVGNGLINLLPNNEHRSAFLSRYGQLRSKAESLNLISAEWVDVPTPAASLEAAKNIAIETYESEINNNPPSSNTFFASMGLATNNVIKFIFLALVSGFIGAIGEQYASHKKIKSIIKTDSVQT